MGLGVEQALTPAWSVKAEHNYLHFGGPSVATPPTVQNPAVRSSSGEHKKIGLNYHFGGDPRTAQCSDAPLYAKAPAGAPIAYTAGWSFEGGSRLWLSGTIPIEQ